MINPKKTLRDCAIAALTFEIAAFIFLIFAGAVAIDFYFYDEYGYCYDHDPYAGGIVEIVATIPCIVSIILSSVIVSGKVKKVKGIAVGNVVIGALVFILSAAGMGVWSDLMQILAFCFVFIAMGLSASVLGVACSKKELKDKVKMSTDRAAAALRDYKILHDSGLLHHE